MFEAALETIKPNFPPGIKQGDARYSNLYFNMSNGANVRGPWNEGSSTGLKEIWQYVENPTQFVNETQGLTDLTPEGTVRTNEEIEIKNTELGKKRGQEIRQAIPKGENHWSTYSSIKITKKQ